MSTETAAVEQTCLHCGETRAWAKVPGRICGIESRGETIELVEEFANHRWADWRDAELDHFGILPEAYDRHRRRLVMHMQWVACEDMKRGHSPAKEDDAEWGLKLGQCWACGLDTLAPPVEVSRGSGPDAG